MKLAKSVTCFEEFKLSFRYKNQKYESKMLSKQVKITPCNLQSDVLTVYYKVLAYLITVQINQSFLETLSFNNDFKVYFGKEYFNLPSANVKGSKN